MITVTEDPVQVWINRLHGFGLTLMDENVTISAGMNTPNQVVTTPLDFEQQNKEVINSRVEQYRGPLLLACSVTTRFALKKYKRLLSATRSASNR